MLLRDVLKISKLNTFRGKTRTFLTVFSITIGIASVLLISSIGKTGEKFVINEIEKMGLQGISVYPAATDSSEPLLASDADRLKRRFNEIEAAIPMVFDFGKFKLNRTASSGVFMGVGENADEVYDITIIHGKIPDPSDVERKSKVAVVDDELAMKTYRRTNVVGKKIVVSYNGKTEECEIIGVIKSQKDGINRLFGNNIPDFIYMPYTTLNELRNSEEISQIAINTNANCGDGNDFANFLGKIKGKKDAFYAENVSSKMNEIKSITGLISLLITTIGAIALVVAGIGIMNSMFSSCTERRREIGICMALGAKESDILICFLSEAVIISLIGGTIGGIIGVVGGSIISNKLGLEYLFNLKTFIAAEVISILFGIIFSILPAIKAARLDPIKALRRD